MVSNDRRDLSAERLSVIVAAILVTLTVVVSSFFSMQILLAFLCLLLCVAIGLLVGLVCARNAHAAQPNNLQLLCDLASDEKMAETHEAIAESLLNIADQSDTVFRRLAEQRLSSVVGNCKALGKGQIVFDSTETWRIAYEELLRSPGLHLYRSVAHIKSKHYWQDVPGQQSTQLNLELHDAGQVSIERTVIISDDLWPHDELFPVEPIRNWLDLQHRYGIWLRMVRESQLENEPELVVDLGIYGSRAVGFQSSDPSGRTLRFLLDFNFDEVIKAEEKWDRLAVYATSYRDLLDPQH